MCVCFRIANADIQGRRIANPPKLEPKQKPILNFGCKDNEITQLALLIILLTKKMRIYLFERAKMIYLCKTRFFGED